MKIGGFAIVCLAGGLLTAAPAQAKRSSHRPAYAPPPLAAPVYGAPAAPVRSSPVWGADGYRFDPPAGAAPLAPPPYGY